MSKRKADIQLTKDANPEEIEEGEEGEKWKPADPEVLKGRRIVKAKRRGAQAKPTSLDKSDNTVSDPPPANLPQWNFSFVSNAASGTKPFPIEQVDITAQSTLSPETVKKLASKFQPSETPLPDTAQGQPFFPIEQVDITAQSTLSPETVRRLAAGSQDAAPGFKSFPIEQVDITAQSNLSPETVRRLASGSQNAAPGFNSFPIEQVDITAQSTLSPETVRKLAAQFRPSETFLPDLSQSNAEKNDSDPEIHATKKQEEKIEAVDKDYPVYDVQSSGWKPLSLNVSMELPSFQSWKGSVPVFGAASENSGDPTNTSTSQDKSDAEEGKKSTEGK